MESTSIHLIQSGIAKLLSLFPTRDCDDYTVRHYNRITAEEFVGVRDFRVLHYHSTRDKPEALWNACRSMALPEGLVYKGQ